MTSKAVLRCIAAAGLVAALGLSGCGRRGDLEPAPGSGVSAKQARERALQQQQEGATNAPVDGTVANSRLLRNITPPKDPFVLDPLL